MKKSRYIALILASLMLFALITACGDKADPASDGPIQLVFSLWGDPAEQETTQAALDVYNNMQDKVYVTALQIGRDDYVERLQVMAANNEMPDCGMVAEDTAIGWARDGLLSTYDVYAGASEKPLDYVIFKNEGEPVAYSSANEVLAIWYNPDIFDAAGVAYPPAVSANAWTWDEFVAVAKSLTFDANGNNPDDADFDANNIVQYGGSVNTYTWQLEAFALSNGGRFFSQDGKSIVFDDAAIEAIQMIADLHLVHKVAPFNDGTVDDGFFLSVGRGDTAMGTDGQWVTGFRGFFEDVNYQVAVLPYMKQKANIATAGPAAMFATTQYPEETAAFLRWYNDPENNMGPIIEGWWMPNLLSWYDDAKLPAWIDASPVRVPLGDAYKTAIVDVAMDLNITKSTAWYYTPNTYEVYTGVLQPALVEVFQGSKTAKEVIEAIRPAMEAALAG
ncbi:MAG: extracellular solute-binding protein [Oscillospiraceae bacterium]|nr:extracellular solute-binding protein [Oscillospiraceae bacterium]